MKIATTAVLLIKPDNIETIKKTQQAKKTALESDDDEDDDDIDLE